MQVTSNYGCSDQLKLLTTEMVNVIDLDDPLSYWLRFDDLGVT